MMKRTAWSWLFLAAMGWACWCFALRGAGAQTTEALRAAGSSLKDEGAKEAGPEGGASGAIHGADASHGYVIGPGDILAVNVWKDTELSRVMPVRPDGKISLPVLGELQAAGLTALQLQTQIGDKLRDYVRNPQVNVIVQEIKSHTFNVVGKVVKSGSFDLDKPTTVLDALALAGGFQDFARLSKIYVLRHSAGGAPTIMPFNYKQVIKGKHADENIQLQSGDTVVVP